jgi:hypothetical protein
MAALEPFTQLLAGGDERIELARACLLIAETPIRGLDVEGYVNEVARLALRLRARLSRTAGAEEKVVELNQFLFDELGLRRQRRGVLRSAKFLSERGDRSPHRHPDHALGALHRARSQDRAAARRRVVPRAISSCACACAAACWCSTRSPAASRRV